MAANLINPIFTLFLLVFLYFKIRYRPILHLTIFVILFFSAKYIFILGKSQLNLIFLAGFISILLVNINYFNNTDNEEFAKERLSKLTSFDRALLVTVLLGWLLVKVSLS